VIIKQLIQNSQSLRTSYQT